MPKIPELERDVDSIEKKASEEKEIPNVKRYFIFDRLVESNEKKRLRNYCKKHNIPIIDIKFDQEEYKKCGYDLSVLPDSYFWFKKKTDKEQAALNLALRRRKNCYLLNVNGSRNTAILDGKAKYDWTILSDETDTPTNKTIEFLKIATLENSGPKYVISGSDNSSSVSKLHLAFRQDSQDLFDEMRAFGNSTKAELLNRIGLGKIKLSQYSWQQTLPLKSSEYRRYII